MRLTDPVLGYQSHSARAIFESLRLATQENADVLSTAPGGSPFGMHYRTLGDVAYFMLSLNTQPEVTRTVEERIWTALQNK